MKMRSAHSGESGFLSNGSVSRAVYVDIITLHDHLAKVIGREEGDRCIRFIKNKNCTLKERLCLRCRNQQFEISVKLINRKSNWQTTL